MDETPKESGGGLPEEQPDEVAGDEGGASSDRHDRQGDGDDASTESGDGTATGNRKAAG